jgi:hypothetical protein
MGSWNATCGLTRTPIWAGNDIVVFTVFPGIFCNSPSSNGMPLMFGVPQYAEYDDYGGAENYKNPRLEEFSRNLLANNSFYKTHPFKGDGSYDNTERMVMASNKMLDTAHRTLKPLFYAECGISQWAKKSEHSDAHSAAYKLTMEAIETLGKLLEQPLPETYEAAMSTLYGYVNKVFGEARAAHAWTLLTPILFTNPSSIMVHAAAYQAIVAEWGSRKVHWSDEPKRKMPLRELVTEQFDNFNKAWEQSVEKREQRKLRYAGQLEALEAFDSLEFSMSARGAYDFLMPMSRPWRCKDMPISSLFWDEVTPQEVIAQVGKEALLDTFVFSWALNYMRIDFTVPRSGSQCDETVLTKTMFDAVFKQFKKDGLIRRDLLDSVYRS